MVYKNTNTRIFRGYEYIKLLVYKNTNTRIFRGYENIKLLVYKNTNTRIFRGYDDIKLLVYKNTNTRIEINHVALNRLFLYFQVTFNLKRAMPYLSEPFETFSYQ